MSSETVRKLTAAQLGAAPPVVTRSPPAAASDAALLPDDDRILVAVRHAISDGYGGVILSGVPGTGKSRHADLVASKLVDADAARFKSIQFHPSYQYEDFVEGYVIKGSNFTRKLKTFGQLCIDASEDDAGRLYVIVIDEISRSDVARVFGEAFTYIERSKRGREFFLASGTEMIVPDNLFVIGTMNPWDRGVDELDMALERRFAFLEMAPDPDALRSLLTDNGLSVALIDSAVAFFDFLQGFRIERCRLGHGYFVHAKDRESLLRLWELQLAHVLQRACSTNAGAFTAIQQRWNDLVVNPAPQTST
jgi:5-methylcytosine-specific restriction enzyme B